MVEFLDSSNVSRKLAEIIKNAKEQIILISPYMELDSRIKRLLENKSESGINIFILYRPAKSNKEAINWLKKLPNRRIYYRTYLHSKCYLNEKLAMITSMNMTKKSQQENYEMGILLNKKDHLNVYSSIKKEVNHLFDVSDEKYKSKQKRKGYCIRCKKEIDLDTTSPYCRSCYKNWKKYYNPEYKEKYCHICGKEHETKMNKPVCNECYKKFEDRLKYIKK